MNKSENIAELATALCKAQSEMEPASKDASNPFFKSKYADLNSIWTAARIPLTKNGLSVVQALKQDDTCTLLVTTLCHSSGQWIESSAPIQPDKPGPQALGSCISYMRRYALSAMIGIVAEDDDAEGAMNRPQQYSKPMPQVTRTQNPIKPIAKEGMIIQK